MFRPQQIQVPVGADQLPMVPSIRRDLPVLINPSVPVSRDLLGNGLPTVATPLPDEKKRPVSTPYVDTLSLSGLGHPTAAGGDIAATDPEATAAPRFESQKQIQDAQQAREAAAAAAEEEALWAMEEQRLALAAAAAARAAAESRRDTLVAGGLSCCVLLIAVCGVCVVLHRRK